MTAVTFSKLMLPLCVGLAGCSGFTFADTSSRNITTDMESLATGAAATVTLPADLPIGSVTYSGVLTATTTGDFAGDMYADLTMAVDFDSNAITGTIDNVDLVDPTTSTISQSLTGSLDLTGTQTSSVLTATATGSLTGLGDITGTAATILTMGGAIRTDTTDGDTVYGDVVTGAATGGFDLIFTDGEFYGTTP